ncbi:MAG TPA: TolC family protein [Blastocatellia bacterium]|nr:TolC family protein [Blastocatellia bacterium]
MIKPTNRPARILHSALASRVAGGLAAALLSVTLMTAVRGQQPAQSPQQSPQQNPPTPATNQNPPTPAPNPGQPNQAQPSPAAPAAQPQSQTPAPQQAQPQARAVAPLALGDVVTQAIAQASSFQQARIEELIAAEDVRQARLAFLPRLTSPLSFIYNSPALGPNAQPGVQSFIAANAIREYEALVGVTGDLDLSGRLRASLRRSAALLEAAHAGTEVARRALVQGVNEAYYGLALAAARRRSAELSLAAAEEFEHVTQLMFQAGEVAEVDYTRARLQTATRRDELEQARAAELVAADTLRVFVGYDFSRPIATTDLTIAPPDINELNRFTAAGINERPELRQFDAQRRAAEQEVNVARADRRPQVSYNINGGFDTDSLKPSPLKEHTGVLASISLTIPLFDWGISRSRERQAQLRAQSVEAQRALALRTFNQQFYSAREQALSAARRVQTLQAAVTDAERNVQTSVARYRAGEAPILEVTDALTTLAAQRAALFQALFDYQIARTRLAQAAGQ